ncbi:hypothetical protein SLS60_003974 [Paraconiothyrium brasiliense]|uniref:Uncharacterized protein n=1 Tax=Paraconiothyrium brasiliense TaxID=300254 RepID=A0ABR3RR16_9PLEO
MASPYETQKKRPPPIEIPRSYPQRQIVPGPNAFAIAERAAKEEQRRRAESAQKQPVSHPSTSGYGGEQQWGASTADGPSSSGDPHSNSLRKLGHSQKSASVKSRQEPTVQSRYNDRNYPSFTATQRQFLGLSEEPTSRAEIEAQKERKLFKMMGQVPDTPTDGAAPVLGDHVSINDLRQGRVSQVEVPPIPPRKDSLPPHVRQFPEFDSSFETRTLETFRAMEALSQTRTMSQLLQPPSPDTEPEDFHDSGMKLFLPSVPEMNPIPSEGGTSPSKYCPPGTADKPEFVEGEPLFSAHGDIAYTTEEEDEATHSAPLKSLDKAPLSALRAEHRSAPATPITATSGGLQHRAPQAEGTPPGQRSPQLEYLLPTVYSPPKTSVRRRAAQQTEDPFQPADRPRSDTHRLSSQRGSIPIVFQGDLSEIDPLSATARSVSNAASAPPVLAPRTYDNVTRPDLAARIMEELRIKPRNDGPATAPTHGPLQPEQSSSQLTDMLSGVSPSRADFHGYDSSSAVPSPLHRTPQAPQGAMGPQQAATNVSILNTGQAPSAFPITPIPPPPRAGIALHDHFFMTNEHIDVIAMSIYDWVSKCNNQAREAASLKHEQLRTTVEQRFDDIKSQINSVGEKADHNGNQSHNLSVQLDKLRDFIKAEVVEPLTAQTAKMNAMDHGIKELQKAVQDLQSQSQASTVVYPSPNQPKESLVNSRSQTSFPPFYDPNSPAAPPGPLGPPGFGRFGNNTQLGRTAYSRESRENSSYAFPSIGNPYHSAGAPFPNAYGGGYQQPMNNYPSVHDQQSYGYNQGLPK